MGRRLSTSTPTVIQTELVPLDDSFYIERIGEEQQWYYDNTRQYKPNRLLIPLELIPHLTAVDKDTKQEYSSDGGTLTLGSVTWTVRAYDEQQGKYVDTTVSSVTPSDEYYLVGNNLMVRKNVSYSHAVTIFCSASYNDPRDTGVAYVVNDQVILLTSRDANIEYPNLDIMCPSSQSFNPLLDESSEFTMKAKADFDAVTSQSGKPYRADPLGTEEIVPQNDTDGVVTVAPTIDIRYGDVEQYDQTFMRRQTGGGVLSAIDGNKAYLQKVKGNTVAWMQLCENGNFADTSKWQNRKVTYSISNNEVSVTGTNESGEHYFAQALSLETNHKFYFHVEQKTSNINVSANDKRLFFANMVILSLWSTETDKWNVLQGIVTSGSTTGVSEIRLYTQAGVTTQYRNVFLFDLTVMGIANLTTTAEVESWLAANIGLKPYYPYNAGELVNVKMTGIKSVGFNQWDEEWRNGYYEKSNQTNIGKFVPLATAVANKNPIPVFPNTYYKFRQGTSTPAAGSIFFYDKSLNYISYTNTSRTDPFITPSNCYYINFNFNASPYGSVYGNDVCINISNATKNGTYEAYWSKTAPFDPRKVYGKLNGAGSMVQIAANGISSVGEVSDEINIGISEAKIKVGSRAYQSGDESDTSVITDGTTTFYPLSAELHYTDCMYSEDGGQTFIPLDRAINYEWYGISNNTEVKADTLPWYRSGQNTDTLVVDAMYGEDIRVVLRAKDEVGNLIPPKAYRSIHWRIPDTDTNVKSDNGGAVRSDTKQMAFDTIVNVKGTVLSEEKKKANLRFNWVTRYDNSSQEVDKGWGQKKTIQAQDLVNVHGNATTLVFPYVYLLGAYEQVTEDGIVVTENGETVYDRPL